MMGTGQARPEQPASMHSYHPRLDEFADQVVAFARRRMSADAHGLALEHVQSNAEHELVEAVHRARSRCAAIVVNAAALTHYGWSLHDALAAYDGVVVELHLSNPNAREAWRHTSVVAPVATGTVCGFGGHGYTLAALAVLELIGAPR